MPRKPTAGMRLGRRDFLAAGVAIAGTSRAVRGRPFQGPRTDIVFDPAPPGRPLTAGLIGCGGRGRGAALNFIDAGPGLRVTALADVFEERVEAARRSLLEQRGLQVESSRCFVGFDAFKKLIDSGVDVVLDATPPHFRPRHFEAATRAGKHSFLEKPVAVDPVGVRAVIATSETAESKGLSVVTGTQLRYDKGRGELRKRVLDGAIGEIVAIRCIRNQGALWYQPRREGWSDMEAMIRDWVNWNWLSGDHIVEQHVHHLDQMTWFTGMNPVRVTGVGGRARRPTGDQYDFFGLDYEFETGIHMHSMCRQINGCANERVEVLVGERGICDLGETVLLDFDGKVLWRYEGPRTNQLVQEHALLVRAIREEKPYNNAVPMAESTLVAVMGREAAYSGGAPTWDEMMHSYLRLGPNEYAMGPVDIEKKPPVPGADPGPPSRDL